MCMDPTPFLRIDPKTKKTFGKAGKTFVKPPADESDSSDSFSDGDEEDQKDYKVGGYHPVEIGEVYNEKYKVLCKTGWGQYSTVWLIRDLTNGKLYALKIQKSASSYMEAAQDELKLFNIVMKNVREKKRENPNAVIHIVELIDDFLFTGINGTHMCFVYERLGGSLLDLIKHYNYQGVPLRIAKPLIHDMLDGLAFLHDCGIIHTDVKPENVLLLSPLPSPPPEQKTMYDCVIEEINKNEQVIELRKQYEQDNLTDEEKKRLKMKLKKLRARIKKNMSNNGIPSLWGFMRFNYKSKEVDSIAEIDLKKVTWTYPDDCYYIKMYVLCPLKEMQEGLGEKHGYGDENREECSEWTFEFLCGNNETSMFQVRGHGRDRHTRVHDLRHVVMNDMNCDDKADHLLWSLRFDGRRIRSVFSALEALIPGFVVLHLPDAKYSLSAYEHSLIKSVGKEFLPPETTIFKNLNGVLVGLFIPSTPTHLQILPLEERLSMWPSDAILNETISKNRQIEEYFGENDVIGCKLVDLGNSCLFNKPYTNDIQTRQYRCPETILHSPYSFSADIWSAACVIFELLTGDYLFQPREHGAVSRDQEHLAMFEEIMGRFPKEVLRSGKRWKEFVRSDGKLIYQKPVAPHKIAYYLQKKGIGLDECVLIEDLLQSMLAFVPDDRLTAKECLKHPWFVSTS